MIPDSQRHKIRPTSQRIGAADGRLVPHVRSIRLKLTFLGQKVKAKFLEEENMDDDCVAGSNLLWKFGLKLSV